MTNLKKVYNQTRLRNLKRAKLKQKECELNLYIKKGYDEKTITHTMSEIQQLKTDIKNLNS